MLFALFACSASARAFSASSLFNQALAEKMENANEAVSGFTPGEVASDEDYWSVIQQAYTVDPNIINLNNNEILLNFTDYFTRSSRDRRNTELFTTPSTV